MRNSNYLIEYVITILNLLFVCLIQLYATLMGLGFLKALLESIARELFDPEGYKCQ